MSNIVRFLEQDDGVTAIEYALIAGATGLVLITILPLIESALRTTFTALAAAM